MTLLVWKYVGGISFVASGWKMVPTYYEGRVNSTRARHVI